MYTLKIRQNVTTEYIPVKMLRVGVSIETIEDYLELKTKWAELDHEIWDRLSRTSDNYNDIVPGKIVTAIDEENHWYAVSHAWLLGPNGATIERIAP